jgi:hypothetical protein
VNALLRKEFRILAPGFPIALLLSFSSFLLPGDNGSNWKEMLFFLPFIICPAMLLMTALASFGQEFASGTFSTLIAQPIPRARIWWTKSLLLLAVFGIITAFWLFSFYLGAPAHVVRDSPGVTVIAVVFALCMYSGALWSTLLFRQVAVAFWFTLLIPFGLLMTVVNLMTDHRESMKGTLVLVFLVYSVGGFCWAWRLFLRAQDTKWTGGTISLPQLPRNFGWRVNQSIRRRSRPRIALFGKEIQLHQSQLMIAGVLLLLHLAVIAVRTLGNGLREFPTLSFVMEHFWWLWLLMPFLVGCAAVAEERKLGTLEAQSCLPAKRWIQFAAKLMSALLLSVILGAVMPVILEGNKILPAIHFSFPWATAEGEGWLFIATMTALAFIEQINPLLPCVVLAGISTFICLMSFYASTLARDTLQSFAPAALVIIATLFLLGNANDIEELTKFPLWRGPLIYLTGVPAMAGTLLWLAFGNYGHARVALILVCRNGLAWLATFACVMTITTVLYQRVWELIPIAEPRHGAPRIPATGTVKMQSNSGRLVVALPDGRVWTDRRTLFIPDLKGILAGGRPLSYPDFFAGRFVEGTNWANVAICAWDLVGIKIDGSLWVSEQSDDPESLRARMGSGNANPDTTRMIRYGDENNWKHVAEQHSSALLLKTDGTLWRLGTNRFSWSNPWPGLRNLEVKRLGNDSDWAEIRCADQDIYLRSADGSMWTLQSLRNPGHSVPLDSQTQIQRAPHMDGTQWQSRAWISGHWPGAAEVEVRPDGTFRVVSAWEFQSNKWSLTERDKQLGNESDWLAVSGNGEAVTTLKSDGSLWKWNFPDDSAGKPETTFAVRLGRYSDWRAIAFDSVGVVSLAADGSLWNWQFESSHQTGPRSSLLRTSRTPRLIGNIFE